MRVIGVIDLLRGRAVHARGGDRERYAPVRVGANAFEPGDALALGRWYVGQLGIEELYVADLDALTGGASQNAALAPIAALGAPLIVDAGVTTADRARAMLAAGADRVVAALETLDSYRALGQVCAAVGCERVAFSLDLRNGQPVVAPASEVSSCEPAELIARRASDAGVGCVIVIDLARVGTGAGLDLDLLARVRRATPGLVLVAGGGVRGDEDLARLSDVGCDGALVASALLDGRLGPEAIAGARGPRRQGSFSR